MMLLRLTLPPRCYQTLPWLRKENWFVHLFIHILYIKDRGKSLQNENETKRLKMIYVFFYATTACLLKIRHHEIKPPLRLLLFT